MTCVILEASDKFLQLRIQNLKKRFDNQSKQLKIISEDIDKVKTDCVIQIDKSYYSFESYEIETLKYFLNKVIPKSIYWIIEGDKLKLIFTME